MYEIIVNHAKNRLYYRLDGFMDDVALSKAASEFMAQVDTLRPSIDLVSDIGGFKPASPEGAREIQRAMQYGYARGIRHIIRVVGPNGLNVISRIQFTRLANEVGPTGVTEEVASRAEAERRLDALNLGTNWRA